MFGLFKKKCPVCKMKLEEGRSYPEGHGKEFCSESCKEGYQKRLTEEQSQHSKGNCCR